MLTACVGLCQVHVKVTYIAKPVSMREELAESYLRLDEALTFVGDELGAFEGLSVVPTGALVGD